MNRFHFTIKILIFSSFDVFTAKAAACDVADFVEKFCFEKWRKLWHKVAVLAKKLTSQIEIGFLSFFWKSKCEWNIVIANMPEHTHIVREREKVKERRKTIGRKIDFTIFSTTWFFIIFVSRKSSSSCLVEWRWTKKKSLNYKFTSSSELKWKCKETKKKKHFM